MRTSIESDGYTPAKDEIPQADLNIVTPGFFEALGGRLLAGRDFDARDTATSPPVAIVSEAMARKFWPGVNPVGRRIMNLGPPGVGGEVIGVVRDVRFRSLRRSPDPMVFVPAVAVLHAADDDPRRRRDRSRRPRTPARRGRRRPGRGPSALPRPHAPGEARSRARPEPADRHPRRRLRRRWRCCSRRPGSTASCPTRRRPARASSASGWRSVPGKPTSGSSSWRAARASPSSASAPGSRRGRGSHAPGRRRSSSASLPSIPVSFAAAGAVLAAAVLAASTIPAERAARVEPMTALRSE